MGSEGLELRRQWLFSTQAQAVLGSEGEHLEPSVFPGGELPVSGDYGEVGGVIEKTPAGVFDPALLGAPQVEEVPVAAPGQKGVLVGVEETLGQLGGGCVGAVDLEVQSQGMGREGTQPPVPAVGQGELNLGGLGKEGLAPRAGCDGAKLFRRTVGIAAGGSEQQSPGIPLFPRKGGTEDRRLSWGGKAGQG